jgi:type IV pilus assembly protein PilM
VGTLPSTHTVVGIPTNRSFSRTFRIPAKAEKTLSDAVEIEVDQYIPIPSAALYIDYEIIERTKEQLTIIMSAVPKILIDNVLEATSHAGLEPVMVEPGVNAVARVLQTTEEGHLPTLIVDIGPASTDIAILDGGAIRISGGLGIGGNTFTLDIAQKLNVTLENAHQLKVLNGLNAGPRQAKLSQALHPSLQRISTEVRKVMRYYTERVEGGSKIEQVLVVGSGSNVPGIGDYFTNELVMAARVASPWQRLDFGTLPQPHKQFRPRYITVAGLASVRTGDVWK